MEFSTLIIELFPRLSDEQAFMVQQTLYALVDAFDAHHNHRIERYLLDTSNPDSYANPVDPKMLQDNSF